LNHPPEIFLFVGRLHPLLVHLPIGMIVVLAMLELAARIPRFKNAGASAGFILAFVTPLAVITAGCGWLLSLAGGYEEKLLEWHKWLGLATAAGCVVTAILFRSKKNCAYRTSLFATAAVLMAAGHLGGSLTHGSDYLTRYAPAPIKKLLGVADDKKFSPFASIKDPQQLPVFAGIIAPVLGKNCVACHGPDKSKAKLRLDSFAGLMKGSKNGAIFKPGDAEHSELVQRTLLPPASDDHMPPAGKPQPTADDLALLRWWIDAGAPEIKTVAGLKPPANILKIIAARFDIPAALP
jgi:uncharacterized membrane protein/mono/diheme cytochrome c family protein